jgi:flavodoxin
MKSIFVMRQRYNKKHICANCENIDAFSETDDWDKLCNFAVSNRKHTMEIMTILASSIVIFFSHAGDNYSVGNIEVGNTKIVADYISEITGADQYEIVTHKYDGMAYTPLTNLAKEEANKGELPPYEGEAPDLSKYDTVFIGGPIWWGTYPQVMFTLFKDINLDGKTVIPFTTHEGSGLANTVQDVKKAFPKANVKPGFAIYGHEVRTGRAKVEKWLKGLGY